MGTNDHKQLLSDYANGRMTVEMAMGHVLQHMEKLYDLQATANINRYELRGRVDTLDKRVFFLQTEVAVRLHTIVVGIETRFFRSKSSFFG